MHPKNSSLVPANLILPDDPDDPDDPDESAFTINGKEKVARSVTDRFLTRAGNFSLTLERSFITHQQQKELVDLIGTRAQSIEARLKDSIKKRV